MRCPKCDFKQKKKEGDICKQCGRHYVLLPGSAPLHDYKLKRLLERLSAKGHYPFTRNQLVMALAMQMHTTISSVALLIMGIIAISCLILIGTSLHHANLPLIAYIFYFLTAWSGYQLIRAIWPRITKVGKATDHIQQAKKLIDRYQQQEPIPGLVTGKAFETPIESGVRESFKGFAPERVLVVERDDLVDALVLARFHMENRVAIVSQGGYPRQIFQALPKFLQNNPKITVLVAHDASRQGTKLLQRLRNDPQWAFAREHFQDIGISLASLKASTPLPWIDSQGRMVFSTAHKQHYMAGGRLPLDTLAPAPLTRLLATAVLAGTLIGLSDLAASSSSSSGDSGDYG